jgi:glycosyltransferase involved in cell wall biosynthesis
MLRGPLDRTRTRVATGLQPVENWSRPLAGEGARLDGPPAVGGEAWLARSRPHAATTFLHCAIATSALDTGGIEEVVAFLARRLPERGIATSVVHVDGAGARRGDPPARTASALRREGIPVFELSRDDGAAWLATHAVDVISTHGPTGWVPAAAEARGIPVVETLHGGELLEAPPACARRTEGTPAGVIAVSDVIRRRWLADHPWSPAERVVTIPNGVDQVHRPVVDREQARRWLGLDDEFLFLSLSRHALQKNVFGLVTAFADVSRRHEACRLLVAGRVEDPLYAEQVRALSRRVPGSQRVHLRMHTEHAPALLAAADAFVLDSFWEGWSLSSTEALFAGLPVVLSDVSGAREQVGHDGSRGAIVTNPLGGPELVTWDAMRRARFAPQANREALVTAMAALVDDRDRWHEERPRLRAESRRRFSDETWLTRYARTLARIALERVPSTASGGAPR